MPRRLRAGWRQEWEDELRYRETLLAEWNNLNWKTKLDLLWHSLGALMDALWLQPRILNLNVDGQAEMSRGQVVSGNYFAGLGAPASLGRALTTDDHRACYAVVAGCGGIGWAAARRAALVDPTVALRYE